MINRLINKWFTKDLCIKSDMSYEEIDRLVNQLIYFDEGNRIYNSGIFKHIDKPFYGKATSTGYAFTVQTIYRASTKALINLEIKDSNVILKARISRYSQIFINLLVGILVVIMTLSIIIGFVTGGILSAVVSFGMVLFYSAIVISMLFIFHVIFLKEAEWAFELISKSIIQEVALVSERYKKIL